MKGVSAGVAVVAAGCPKSGAGRFGARPGRAAGAPGSSSVDGHAGVDARPGVGKASRPTVGKASRPSVGSPSLFPRARSIGRARGVDGASGVCVDLRSFLCRIDACAIATGRRRVAGGNAYSEEEQVIANGHADTSKP